MKCQRYNALDLLLRFVYAFSVICTTYATFFVPFRFDVVFYFKSLPNVLLCALLNCVVLYCIVLYCTVLYCTVLYCTVLYCTV